MVGRRYIKYKYYPQEDLEVSVGKGEKKVRIVFLAGEEIKGKVFRERDGSVSFVVKTPKGDVVFRYDSMKEFLDSWSRVPGAPYD